uniref:Immunoglobulin-binding protein 1 n=1 Tax=Angiostrongylus cantonensis TaxID=6313 RepID=A0A158P9A8_ANGCA
MFTTEGTDGGDGDGDSRTLADEFKKAEKVINDITDGHFSTADLQYCIECSDEANSLKKKFTGEELREQKIARFRKEKELKAIIEQLRGHLDLNKTDESVQRTLHLTVLRYWSQKVLEELESIEGELPLVEMMQKRMQASSKEKGPSVVDKKPSVNSSLLVSGGKSEGLKPFIITRSTQQKSVFGLGYPSIPTMTVDEWYNQRFGSTSISSQKEGRTCPASNAEDACSSECDQEENDEQSRMKSMIWDDYKDYHRRGWGNTHNKG